MAILYFLLFVKVILWLTHHKNDPTCSQDDTRYSNEQSSWDQDFLKVDQGTLFELVLVCLFFRFINQ